jgi:hypothetical protein
MRPITINSSNVAQAVQQLANASQDNDASQVAQNFTFDTPPTQTLELLVASPTLANTNAVLATLIEIFQKAGINRTT